MSTNYDEDTLYLPQVDKLRDMLSETNSFQRQLGLPVGSSAAEAKKKIHVPAFDLTRLKYELPFAVIEIGTTIALNIDAGGDKNVLGATGQLRLALADISRFPGDLEQATRDFVAWCGAVITQLADAPSDGRLPITSISQEVAPTISDEVESAAIGPWFIAVYLIGWS